MRSVSATPLLLFLVAAHALGPLQFGFHIGELNSPRQAISESIRLDEVRYASIVSVFPIGGLVGSLVAGRLSDRFGRKPVSLLNCVGFVIGPVAMALSSTYLHLLLGRFLSGVSSGASIVIVPIFLSEISPDEIRGTIGVMTQLSCVIGILLAQVAGVFLSSDPHWRLILLGGAAFGLAQFVLLLWTHESPKWLALQPGRYNEAKQSLIRIRNRTDVAAEIKGWSRAQHAHEDGEDEDLEARALLDRQGTGKPMTLSLIHFLSSARYRPALAAVIITQLAQQFTGTNAVIFYSTSILSTLLPDLAAWISVSISVVNLAVTLISAQLIDRLGRRILLLSSLCGMTVSSLSLGIGIDRSLGTLSAFSAVSMIGCFAFGVGPVPFLLISEYFDSESVGFAQSIGISVNWICTFCIGFFFPILRQWLGGYVFFIFAAVGTLSAGAVFFFVPESKGKSAEEIWSR